MPGNDEVEHARTLSPGLMRSCAAIATFGCLALIASNVWGSLVVPDYNWVADTVSDLAAGKYQRIQDYGLYLYAAALLATATGCAHFHAGQFWWSIGCFILLILAFLVSVIGARHSYSDGDGVVIHIYLVYALGALYFIGPFTMLDGLRKRSSTDVRISIAAAISWGIAAPLFFMVPDGYDGLVERILGLISVVWILVLARHLWNAAGNLADENGIK